MMISRSLRAMAATRGRLVSSPAVLSSSSVSGRPSPASALLLSSGHYFHSSTPAAIDIPRAASRIHTTFDLPDPVLHSSEHSMHALVKIVATVGPTSEQRAPLKAVTQAGMNVMRLNFSHATQEEVELRCTNLALAQEELSPAGSTTMQEPRAKLLDTKGPEIRTGTLQNDVSGHDTIRLEAGNMITLRTDAATRDQGSTVENLYIDYPGLVNCLKPGRKVLLDDGAIILTVQEVLDDSVLCQMDNTGDLRSRAGVNLPLADTSDLPALSEKDKADILYGMSDAVDVDFVAASFVQSGAGVRQIRQHIQDCADQLGTFGAHKPLPLIISKIETASALQHFDEILQASDGIMVARGDLGVEIPLQQVTNAQKEMVAACNAVGKPVIVATQMLESIQKNPRPTRAEVSDVTNAVYDGADCVMLSGETAKGQYPDLAVKFMKEIILSAERYARSGGVGHPGHVTKFFAPATPDAAIAKAAVTAARERSAKAILCLTHHGTLPPLVAANRPDVPILAFCPTAKVCRLLQIYRGIHPICFDDDNNDYDVDAALEQAKQMGYVASGDEVVMVSMHDEHSLGNTATMKLATVPR